jgi:hypothetical protein
MSNERALGNLYLRSNIHAMGGHVPPHTHNFPHATFIFKDWWLVRGADHNGNPFVAQFCSPEFDELRAMYAKYEPEKLTRPVRFADVIVNGMPQFVVKFIGAYDAVPDGAEEIVFDPIGYAVLITAEAQHELLCLGNSGNAGCVYAHRTPQGDIVQEFTGWENAYV